MRDIDFSACRVHTRSVSGFADIFKHCEVNQLEIKGQINGEGGRGSNARSADTKYLQFTE